VTASGCTVVPITVNWSASNGPAVEPLTMEVVSADGLTHFAVVGGVALSLSGTGGALANDDYTPISDNFVIPAFNGVWTNILPSVKVKVAIVDDDIVENAEEFVVKLSLADPTVAT